MGWPASPYRNGRESKTTTTAKATLVSYYSGRMCAVWTYCHVEGETVREETKELEREIRVQSNRLRGTLYVGRGSVGETRF